MSTTSKNIAKSNYGNILLKLLRLHKGKSEPLSLNGDKGILHEVFELCGSKIVVDELTSLLLDYECKYNEFGAETRAAVVSLILNNALNFFRGQRCTKVTKERIGELMFIFNQTHNVRAIQHKHEPKR